MVEHVERNFRGLDLSQAPENIGEGFLQVADNCSLDGRDVITRPGFTAILSSAQSSGIYAYTPLVSAMSGEKALYCADSVLRYWAGSNTASTVSGTGTVAHASSQIATMPGAGFLVDGSMNLKRIAFDSSGVPTGAAAVTELDRPNTPTATITSRVIDAVAPANWAVDTGTHTNTNLIGNPYFNGADATGSNVGTYWGIYSGTPKCYTVGSVSGLPTLSSGYTWLRLDTPGNVLVAAVDSGASTLYLDNGYAENTAWSSSSALKRYCHRFLFKCRIVKTGNTARSVNVRLQFYTSIPTADAPPTYETTITVAPTITNKDELIHELIDVSPYVGGSVLYVRMYLSGSSDSSATTDGPYITAVELQAVHPYWDKPSPAPTDAGFIPVGDDVNILSGLYLAHDFGTALNLTGRDSVAFTVLQKATFDPQPAVEVKFQNSGGDVWTSPQTSFGESIEANIADMPASIKSDVDKIAIVFLDDATISGLTKSRTPASTRCAFYIVDLVEPGRLTEGLNYWYVLTEIDSNSDTTLVNVIQSDGSAPTAAITPTAAQRMGNVALGSKVNSSSDYFALWRFGGTYLPSAGSPAPPTGRLLCWLTWASSVTYGTDADKPSSPASGYPLVFGNPYLSWDSSTKVIVDNTPDSWLSGADTYSAGREKAPTAPTTVAAWDNRLWLGKDADIYASWDIETGRNAGIYWTRIAEPITTDPDAPKKGWWTRLNLAPQDSIKRIIPVGRGDAAFLAVLTRYSAFIVTRTGARAFDRQNAAAGDLYLVQQLKGEDVGGVVGIYAATVFENALYWLSDRGLLRWRQGDASPVLVGDSVRRYLNGIDPAITYTSTALAKCSLMAAPHYLYLSVPSSDSATTPDTTLVWHEREKGWTRWSKGFSSGSGDILAGFDGQLWRVGGSGDVTSVGGGATAVSMSLQTRRFGDGTMVSNPGWLFYDVYLPGSTNGSLTFTALGDGTTGASVTQSTLGAVSRRVRVSRSAAGRRADISLSASTVKRLRVRALGLDLIPSHSRRV